VGFFYIILIFVFSLPVTAQVNEKSIELPHVSVSALKVQKRNFNSVLFLTDSSALFGSHRNLNHCLGSLPGFSFKNYGTSGLSSISIRGAAAGHTSICWKGMPVNNPMLGQSDGSLIPGPILENAQIQEGGASQISLSENFGGIIFLGGDDKSTENTIRTGVSVGSFSTLHQWLILKQTQGKLKTSIKSWNQSGQGDYRFRLNGVKRNQTHNYRNFRGLEGSFTMPLSRSISFEAALWSQKSERELAPGLHEVNPQSTQTDESHRIYFEVCRTKYSEKWLISSGISNDHLLFKDPVAHIYSNSKILSQYHKAEYSWVKSGIQFQSQAMLSHSIVHSNAYAERAEMIRWTGLTSIDYQFQKFPLFIKIGLRGEHIVISRQNQSGSSLLPSFTAVYTDNKWGEVRAGYHQKYRFPTLNDLYWPVSGNPGLKPETGFTSDLNWKKFCKISSKWKINSVINLYATSIRNSIQWLPNGNIWKPENIGNVAIRGANILPELQYINGKNKILIGYQLSLCHSVLANERFKGDEAKGKQLIYIPANQSLIRFSYLFGKSDFSFWVQKTGKRNTDPSGNHSLPSFTLFNCRIGSAISLQGGSTLKFFGEAHNLTAVSYQQMVGFPMPLRQCTLGLELHFK